MRGLRFLLITLLILGVLGGTIAIYLRWRKPVPTLFNWKAQVVTVAGDGSPVYRDMPQALRAAFSDPFGIAIGSDGTIYISDAGDSNRVRKITPEGTLTNVAGDKEGFADGIPASFNTPSGLTIDPHGNLYVADTTNNRIRKVTPEGVVSTVAGNGNAGYADGAAAMAEFNGPIGIAIDKQNNIYVADTYNDRIRKIGVDGQVTTLAGRGQPGDADGDSATASFDTPCALVVTSEGSLIVADTGNDKLRKVTPTGQVTTVQIMFVDDPNRQGLRTPIGLAITHDGFLYATEQGRGTVVQIAPDGRAAVLAGNGPGYADGFGNDARFNQLTGIAIDPSSGELVVADSANCLIRRLTKKEILPADSASNDLLPRLNPETIGTQHLLWPLDPQDKPHEVVATMGEVRGSFDSTDSRDHLHSGLDVAGAYGETVRAIRWEKVTSPLSNWGFDQLSEGLRVGLISYIHMQVGRDKDGNMFKDSRFIPLKNDEGKLSRIRVRRGTSFKPGDAVGTVNRMYHVHLIVGPSGSEINPLSFSPVGFRDTRVPTIEKDGVQLFDESGAQLKKTEQGRFNVQSRVRIVVDAFDLTDMNSDRRRLGLYSLGYQVLKDSPDRIPAPGFSSARTTILFNRLPADDSATKIAYAADSGITVYGSKTTRFLYEVTNTVRDGHARTGWWDTSGLEKGDYILRVEVADFSGNQAQRDVSVTVK